MADTLKALETLNKLSKQKLDDKQKEILELLSVIHEMEARMAALHKSIDQEISTAQKSDDIQLYQMAGAFLQRAEHEIADIKEAMTDAERIMNEKRETLRELFAEQKRYEKLIADLLLKRRREKLAKEQASLDESASSRYIYSNES